MNNMINLVALQTENLSQTSSDLINSDHGEQRLLAIDVSSDLCRCNHHRVKIIVSKLTSCMSWNAWVVTKH